MERRYKRSRLELGEHIKESKKSEKDIKETNQKIIALESELEKIKAYLSDITIDLKLKAFTGDVNRIERLLELKFPLSSGNELSNQIKIMAKAEDLINTKADIKCLQEKLEDDYLTKAEAIAEFEKNQKIVSERFELYSTQEYTNQISQKFYKKIVKLSSEIEKVTNKIQLTHEFFDKNLKDFKGEVSLKAFQVDIDKIIQEISEKASKKELSKYISEIAPKISAFQGEIGVFNRVIREQEQSLLKLDEILLEKASKTETQDLYQRLIVLSKNTEIEHKIDDMIKNQRNIKEELSDIQSDTRQIQLQFAEMQTLYSKKANDAIELKFIKDIMLDMQSNISYKADRTEILSCLQQKAGWEDFSNLSQSLEAVHQQIKFLAVQVGAIEKITTPKGKIRNAEKSQRDYFKKITHRLVNYVVSSKPTLEESQMPEEIKAFLNVPNTPKLIDNIKSKNTTPRQRIRHSFDQLNKF